MLIPGQNDYFKEIEMADAAIGRANAILAEFKDILPDLGHVFVSDRYDDDHIRRYMSLWVFGPDVMIEFTNFLVEDRLVFARLVDIVHVEMIKQNIGNPKEQYAANSKLTVKVALSYPIRGELSAMGNNCRHLYAVAEKFLVPFMLKGGKQTDI